MNIFDISPYFTFNWFDNNAISTYNTDPLQADDQRYYQPIQCGGGGYQTDKGQIQLISDFVPTCKLYKSNNIFVKDIALTPINPPIIGNIVVNGVSTPITFVCYNGEIDFSNVAPGLYYAKITYTDDDAVHHDWRTYPITVEIFHDGTQLIEATNDSNDKGVIFVKSDQSTLVISHRVASIIRLPLVKADAEDFEDQYNDLTQEGSIPFVTYTQLLGGPELLPFWVIEKINLLYSLSNITIDGEPFTKLSTSEFKPTRSDVGQGGAWWEVDIQPNSSYPSEQFVTGVPNQGDLIVTRKVWPRPPFANVTNSFIISGVFTIYSTLDYLQTINDGGNTFILKIGTSAGDNDIMQTEIGTPNEDTTIDLIETHRFLRGLNVATDIYVTVPMGVNIKALIIYDQLDSPVLNAPVGSLASQGRVSMWEDMGIALGTPFFTRDWNIANGLGQVGSMYEGMAMSDGRNGTQDRRKLFSYGWDYTDITLPRNHVIGAQQPGNLKSGNLLRSIEEIQPSLPAEGIATLANYVNNTNGDTPNTTEGVARAFSDGHPLSYELHRAPGVGTATLGISANLGDGQDLSIQNDAIVTLYYVEL